MYQTKCVKYCLILTLLNLLQVVKCVELTVELKEDTKLESKFSDEEIIKILSQSDGISKQNGSIAEGILSKSCAPDESKTNAEGSLSKSCAPDESKNNAEGSLSISCASEESKTEGTSSKNCDYEKNKSCSEGILSKYCDSDGSKTDGTLSKSCAFDESKSCMEGFLRTSFASDESKTSVEVSLSKSNNSDKSKIEGPLSKNCASNESKRSVMKCDSGRCSLDVGQEPDGDASIGDDSAYKLANIEPKLYHQQNASTDFFSPYHLFEMVPPFQLHHVKGVSEKCRRHSAIYVENLKTLQMWALKMYDSTTKIPSGFLNGNINQYGDMDQCLDVRHVLTNKDKIQGKYCLASLQLTLSSTASPTIKKIFKLVHSHYAFTSKLSDPGHRVPRFSSINWAVCVPSSCSHEDIALAITHSLSSQDSSHSVSTQVLVDPNMCQIKSERMFSNGFLFVSSLFILFILFTIYATAREIFYKETTAEWILGFSLMKNTLSIFSLKSCDKDDVRAVHGIRCLNALMLIIAHKSMAVYFMPYINRTQMTERLGEAWGVVGRTASLYTDPFIMFSGLLTCYALLGKHRKGQRISVAHEYLSRLFRLVPTLGALMLFCTWVLPELSSGPQWPLVVNKHAQICKKTWWRNLLFIHNYFGFQNMCLTHTHHIGIDTQLFLLGVPLSLWLISNPQQFRRNVAILSLVAALATLGRFYITYSMKLANYVSFGVSVEQLFLTADYMYILPPYRITVYIMGIFLAFLLRYPTHQALTQRQLRLGWLAAVCLFLATFLLPAHMSKMDYQYNVWSQALYASLAPVGWILSFGWIIYTQHHGYNTWLGDIFSLRIFTIWTRLSYAIYLTQFPIFFYYVGTTRSPQYFTVLNQHANMEELIVVGIVSYILTLLFDLPFQNMRKIVCRSDGRMVTFLSKAWGRIVKTLDGISVEKMKKLVGGYTNGWSRTEKELWKKD